VITLKALNIYKASLVKKALVEHFVAAYYKIYKERQNEKRKVALLKSIIT